MVVCLPRVAPPAAAAATAATTPTVPQLFGLLRHSPEPSTPFSVVRLNPVLTVPSPWWNNYMVLPNEFICSSASPLCCMGPGACSCVSFAIAIGIGSRRMEDGAAFTVNFM